MRSLRELIGGIAARAETPEMQQAVIAAEDAARREELERLTEQEREERERLSHTAIETRWRAAGIPRLTIDTLRAGVELRPAIVEVQRWLASDRTFLVLGGDTGAGKTIAAGWAVAQARGIFRKARDVAWMSQYDHEPREQVISAPMVALDDLGTEPLDDKGWALAMLYSVLDARYDAKARTLITTNLGLQAITARYGQDGGRLFRRLRDAGMWIEIGGAP